MVKWFQLPIVIPTGLIVLILIVALFRNSFGF